MITQKLSLKEKIGYGFGDAASSMFWKMFSMYLMFFYTDIFGIPAPLVGTMFLITRIWDAANDPLAGLLGDRTKSRWGKFRPYLLWVALPFGLIGVLTFTTPNLGMTGKILYAYVTYSLMMMVYTLINVPYGALLGVMTSDGKERTTLATFRFVFAFAGSILVFLITLPLVEIFSKIDGGLNVQRGWQLTTVVIAIIAILFFVFTFLWTKERVKPISEKTSLKDDLIDLARNRPWVILLGAGIAVIFFNSIRDGAAMYYFKYFINEQDAFKIKIFKFLIPLSSMYLIVGQSANIVGVVLARPISDLIGKKFTFFYAMQIATVFSFFFYWLDRESIYMIFVFQFLISICAGIVLPLLWSMYADAADYSEWKTGRRATGLIFSASSMSQKFGWTIGGAMAGWLLGYYGFQPNIMQSEDTLHGIKLMLSIYPAVGTVVGALIMYFYPLKESLMDKIEEELAQRRISG